MPNKTIKSLYSVHPAVAYAQAIINNLPKTTGRSLAEWITLVKKTGPAGEKERRGWLKKNYQLGGTTAAMIVARVEGKDAEDTDGEAYLKAAAGYVESMYAGPKAALRPIHDALIALGLGLGSDVKICPCQTIIPFYRQHVFAQIKPSTRTRIDFGLALKRAKKKPPKRLLDTGGLAKGDRITHRIEITSLAGIDAEVKEWLKIAYALEA
ncbi:MAG: hypothetical protein ALAOOOJD_04521 [bacterium]|nr:hypothetical protein [bacterium]